MAGSKKERERDRANVVLRELTLFPDHLNLALACILRTVYMLT